MGSVPPYGVGGDSLFVAYLASAEIGCHLALGWPVPRHILDLYAEFRAVYSGIFPPAGFKLTGALTAYGLDAMPAEEKAYWQDLCKAGGPRTQGERAGLLDYCQTDVDALAQLLPKMLPQLLARHHNPRIALGWALLRGPCHLVSVARMERAGIPIDVPILDALCANWDRLQAAAGPED